MRRPFFIVINFIKKIRFSSGGLFWDQFPKQARKEPFQENG
jgi:hypothetical protein